VTDSTPSEALAGKVSRNATRWKLADLALALLACAIAAAVYLSHYGVGNALSSDNVLHAVVRRAA
jgi:hypothetical protein